MDLSKVVKIGLIAGIGIIATIAIINTIYPSNAINLHEQACMSLANQMIIFLKMNLKICKCLLIMKGKKKTICQP